MSPILKLYLKVFLFTGIPYALIMLVFDLLGGGQFVLTKFMLWLVGFGGLMSLSLVSFYWLKLKKAGVAEITDADLKVNQSRIIQSKFSMKEIRDKLQHDPETRKMKIEEQEGGLILETKATWASWGELIEIKLLSSVNGNNEFEVTSSPKVETTLIDFGKNLKNVNRILRIVGNSMM